MFNGWPAHYPEIAAGMTFTRSVVEVAKGQISNSDKKSVLSLGASGVGKTTAARQLLLTLSDDGYPTWEHRSDNKLPVSAWMRVANDLSRTNRRGFLFVDDGDEHLHELNELFDGLASQNFDGLNITIAASRIHWNPASRHQTYWLDATSP